MKKLLLFACLCMSASAALCADELHSLNDWVPKHWKLIKKAEGDLNGDGVKDAVLIVEENNPANRKKNEGLGAPELNTNARTIVVLFGEQDSYRKLSQSTSFIPPESDEDSPCLDDPLSDIAIKNGLLKVTLSEFLSCGGWETSSKTYTFRFDGKGMRLIGEDESSFMRNSGEKSEVSTNYLTGKRKTTEGLNEFEESKPRTKWETLKHNPPRYLEKF